MVLSELVNLCSLFAQHTYVSYVSSLRSDVVMAINFFTGTFVYLLSHGESVRQKKVSDGSISKPRRQFCTKNPAQILLGS